VVGAIYFPLFAFCVWLLNQMPKPTAAEKVEKTERPAMQYEDRKRFVLYLWPGLSLLWFGTMCLTAYRDFRDTFSRELFRDLGVTVVSGTFSRSETVVGFVVLVPVAALGMIKSNGSAARVCFAYLLIGALFSFTATFLQSTLPEMNPYAYMVRGSWW